MSELREKWKKKIEEYDQNIKIEDEYPFIEPTGDNIWKIRCRDWTDFSYHFMEELMGLLQENKIEEGMVLLDLMIDRWLQLFEGN